MTILRTQNDTLTHSHACNFLPSVGASIKKTEDMSTRRTTSILGGYFGSCVLGTIGVCVYFSSISILLCVFLMSIDEGTVLISRACVSGGTRSRVHPSSSLWFVVTTSRRIATTGVLPQVLTSPLPSRKQRNFVLGRSHCTKNRHHQKQHESAFPPNQSTPTCQDASLPSPSRWRA